MKTLRKSILAWVLALLVLNPTGAFATTEAENTPLVQIALLLDTSNSMDGLIDQAKAQLWKIVNEFVTAKQEGKRPEFQVALYEYGNNSLPAGEGHVRLVLPLTTDLDKISEELFALTTNGGQEYCGYVIQSAADSLDWSDSSSDLKVVFIAGNEPFTQGNVDFRVACRKAISKGATVNTIYCGNYEAGVSTHWRDGALAADGTYMNIDQNQKIVHIDAPQDEEIARLGNELNDTYIAYGTDGRRGLANQMAQDSNAASLAPAINVQRQATKASVQYANPNWDLVDAIEESIVELDELPADDLPEEMRAMSEEERKVYIQEKAKERNRIQQQIQELSQERKTFVAEEMKQRSESGEDTLDQVMLKALHEQAAKKNFRFD